MGVAMAFLFGLAIFSLGLYRHVRRAQVQVRVKREEHE
jgi:hypothetical protein